ncbi:hypothetical protein [Nocardia grenadensis]|uniref:hypothetical protein n=1 Tax=Nocardia grenadensis TaxID=931537 RepID=UPI003D8C7D81
MDQLASLQQDLTRLTPPADLLGGAGIQSASPLRGPHLVDQHCGAVGVALSPGRSIAHCSNRGLN